MNRPPRIIVITGASSGMGRATALRLAARGDHIVVAARRGALLHELAHECQQAGGRAVAVEADVTDPAAVEAVAERAVDEFGRIDAWIHTAAVSSFGRFLDTPIDVVRRVTDVNANGAAIVTHAALRRFLPQGRGTLVLVASVLGKAPIPFLGPYNASKAAVVRLAETIREELNMDDYDDVHVCTLLPPAVDTTFYAHGANYEGRTPRPPPPVYSLETAVDALVSLVDDPKPEVAMGAAGKLIAASHRLAPGIYDALAQPYSESMFLDERAPKGPGSVFEPQPPARAERASSDADGASPRRGR